MEQATYEYFGRRRKEGVEKVIHLFCLLWDMGLSTALLLR